MVGFSWKSIVIVDSCSVSFWEPAATIGAVEDLAVDALFPGPASWFHRDTCTYVVY